MGGISFALSAPSHPVSINIKEHPAQSSDRMKIDIARARDVGAGFKLDFDEYRRWETEKDES